jgi:hypothetical protein
MERTASGHSIRPDPVERCASTELLEDQEAAQRVRDHLAAFRRRNPDSKHERILRSIISPRTRPTHRHRRHFSHRGGSPTDRGGDGQEEAESYPLDNAALESIFSAVNEIFFNGRLSQRVTWDWSHSSSTRYDSSVIGTTALRRAAASTRGFETLIVLSSPILRDPRFSRRLLISTFLHELIHSYLFICCGFRARWCGGHTPGFREIAAIMEEWIGEAAGLYLSRVEADLELFRIDAGFPRGPEAGRDGDGGVGGRKDVKAEFETTATVNVYPCSGMAAEQNEDTVATAPIGPGPPEMVYFGGGLVPGPGACVGDRDGLYLGSGGSPSGHEIPPYHDDRWGGSSSLISSSGSGNIWWRQRRANLPVYVYTGDKSPATYVYPNTALQRPWS